MTITGHGDAARLQLLQQDGRRLRTELLRLTGELSSGLRADLGRATGGDFTRLSGLTRSQDLTEVFARTVGEAALAAGARQAALGRIEDELDGMATRLLGLATGGSGQEMALAVADAGERLGLVVDTLNTRLAGATLFAADRPDRPALIPAGAMLDALRPLAGAAATAADMVAAVEDWFLAPGGGFDTLAWQGGAGPPAPAILGEGVAIEAGVTARDPALREVLAGLALAALVAEGTGPAVEAERRTLVAAAAERLLSGEEALLRLRSDLGAAEARIEEARVATEATRAVLEQEVARITAADPYRTATELEAVETRLEALYLLTARLSRLTLTEYL